MNLQHFTIADLHLCSGALRAAATSATSTRAVAERVVSYLFEELRDSAGEPACPLVRLFRVVPSSTVSDNLDELRLSNSDYEAIRSGQAQKCLVLEASRGIRPEWNDPAASVSHRVIPLSSPDALLRVPMVSALLSQLEVPPDFVFGPPFATPDADRLCNVFHVEDARDNPLVPDQDGFVRLYGVRSVLGFGGLLPDGSGFATLLFSSVPISRETAALFRMLAPSVRSALMLGVSAPTAAALILVSERPNIIERTLRRGGFEPTSRVVQSQAELTDALRERHWDAVIAQSVVGLGVRTVIGFVQELSPGTPVIVVSGPTGVGAAAVEAMKAGANDYVTTDGLARLTPAIERELRAAEARRKGELSNRRLSVALSVTALLSRDGSLESVTSDVLRLIGSGLGWEVGHFWRVDPDTNTMKCVAGWRSESSRFPELERLTFQLLLVAGRGLPGRVWSSGQPAWITDVATDANFPRAVVAVREGLHAAFAFPVRLDDDVIGVFEFFAPGVRPPDADLLATMGAIGTQIGEFVRRARAFSELQSREARSGAIIAAALDAIVTMDAEGRIVDFNRAAERMFGYRREEAIGSEMATLLVPDRLRDAQRRGLARFVVSGVGPIVGRRVNMPGLRKDGTEFPVELTVVQLPTSAPAVFTGFLRDVGDEVNAKEAIESRLLLDEAQAVAHVGSWVTDFGERDRLHWSTEMFRIFGLPSSEAVTFETFLSFVHPEDRVAVVQAREATVLRGEPFDVVHRAVRPDGSVRVIHERGRWAPTGLGRRMVGTAQDITEPHRIMERDRLLAEASSRMTNVVDYPQVLEAVARVAVPFLADGCVVSVAEDRAYGGPRFVAHGAPQLDDRAQKMLREGAVHLPVLLDVLRSGSPHVFPALRSTAARELVEPAFEVELGASSVMSIPLRARGRIIGAITFFRIINIGHYDEFDLATAEDFAHRVGLAVENARLDQQAKDSTRARGEFLAIAAHELKTPVTPLKMQAQNLLRQLESGAQQPDVAGLKARLDVVLRATGRLESLIDSLLDTSELTVGELTLTPSQMDLAELARKVADRMANDIVAAGCSLTVLAPEPVRGQWDAVRMGRVVSNLLSNAMKYGSGKPIEMTVRKHHSSARLSVRDHGIGISRGEQARLFELFERVVPVQEYSGFGLGLWSARQIVAAHGGHIFLWSRPGEGSEFTLELPMGSAEVRDSSGEAPSEPQGAVETQREARQ